MAVGRLSLNWLVNRKAGLQKLKLKRLLIGEGLTLKRLLRSALLVIILTYIGLLLCGVMLGDQLIFQPPRTEYTDTTTTLKIRSRDGVQISAVYLDNPKATYTLLFSHGNAEDLGTLSPTLDSLRRLGFGVFAYDYHGYGTSGGKANEQNAYDDEEAAYQYLVSVVKVPADHIIAFGRSLGGAMAIDLAARQSMAGLVVESSFLSAFRVVTRYPILPFDKFRNIDKITQVRCPVLVIHGRKDEVVSFWHGLRLFESANQPKMNLWVEGAGHNDVAEVAGSEYEQALRDFSATLDRKNTSPAH